MRIYFWSYRQIITGGLVLLLLIIAGTISYGRINAEVTVLQGKSPWQPIYQGNSDSPKMALTFNVDWGEEYLPEILDQLKEYRVKSTFFLTGRWAQKFPAVAKLIAQEGHEIGNHGYSHPHPDRLSKNENQEEIFRTEKALLEITGQKTSLFAPPYGEHGSQVLEAAEELGYRTILWTIDTIDWDSNRSPEMIFAKVKEKAQKGAIVLMHPTERTVQALPLILKYLQQEGYALVTVSQVLN